MAMFRSGGIRIALILLAVSIVGAASGAAAVYWLVIRDLPDFQKIDDYRPPVSSVVLDRKGRLIAEFYTEQRRLVPIAEIPRHVQVAFVSAEDGKFYEHEGFDFVAILRAALANLREGGIAQGASTITQQTVKSLLLSSEKTYERKLKEIVLSWRLEQQLTKDEILYLYLNQIYFGNGAYGVGQAARSYFGKEAKDLTISEAALLAGLPQRPSAYEPNRNPTAAEARRRYVLGRMLADGHIDQATHDAELAAPPVIREHSRSGELRGRGLFQRRGPAPALQGARPGRGPRRRPADRDDPRSRSPAHRARRRAAGTRRPGPPPRLPRPAAQGRAGRTRAASSNASLARTRASSKRRPSRRRRDGADRPSPRPRPRRSPRLSARRPPSRSARASPRARPSKGSSSPSTARSRPRRSASGPASRAGRRSTT